MPAHILPIVEGHGDVAAVPILIRRIASDLGVHDVRVGKPIRCPRHKLVKPGELERAVELAAKKIQGDGQILILIDANSDCPATLAPALAQRARQIARSIPIAVVLAKREFEAWFLASLNSLRENGIPPPDPENIQGTKERLAELMGTSYSATVDQPAFAHRFNMQEARNRCPSFDKCWRAVESLLATVQNA